jgi:hypothetical protein
VHTKSERVDQKVNKLIETYKQYSDKDMHGDKKHERERKAYFSSESEGGEDEQ